LAASLTQEALAERAAISATAIAALERGRRTAPRLSTLRQIGRALDLDPTQLAELTEVATRGRGLPPDPPDDQAPSETLVPPAPGTSSPAPAHPPSPPAGSELRPRYWRNVFTGRTGELADLERAWADRHRLILLTGEAGIGKTRLVSEFADRRAAEGMAVAWGRCVDGGLGPYLPFVEVIRSLTGSMEEHAVAALAGYGGELTRLVPDLARRIGPLPPPTLADAGTEQRLLFEAVAAILAAVAPVVVVLDDIQWADAASLDLLRFLLRDHTLGDVVTVATVRSTDLEPDTAGRLAELGREAQATTIAVDRLGDEDVAALVAHLIAVPVDDAVLRSVVTACEGNPFFAEEMTVHLVDSGLLVDESGRLVLPAGHDELGIPQRVGDTLTRRLLALSPDAVHLLLTGSVLGREFDLSVAGAAAGVDGLRLVDAVDDAVLSGLVEETGPRHLAFTHALVRQAVGARLSYVRAAQVHRQVAETLERQAAGDHDVVAADLARHWAAVAAVDPTAATVAATWAVRAGDVALAAAAADEAIARYEQASVLWSSASQGHADALIRLGIALQYGGRADEADVRFGEAWALASVLDDGVLGARAAIGLGRRYPYWETDSHRIEVLEAALTRLPAGQELLRLTLMGLLVTQLINGFRDDEASRRDELADALAAIADDPTTDDETLASLGHTRLYDCVEDPGRLRVVADRLVTVGSARSDLQVLAVGHFSHALSALDRADASALRAAADAYEAVAGKLDDLRDRSQAATVRSTIAFIEGNYDDSARLTADALELGRSSGDYNAELVSYAQGLLRAVDLGQAADVLPLLRQAGQFQTIASFSAGVALCAALAGDVELARAHLDRMMTTGFAGYPRGADRLAPLAFLAHTCCVVGEESYADRLIEALSAQAAGPFGWDPSSAGGVRSTITSVHSVSWPGVRRGRAAPPSGARDRGGHGGASLPGPHAGSAGPGDRTQERFGVRHLAGGRFGRGRRTGGGGDLDGDRRKVTTPPKRVS